MPEKTISEIRFVETDEGYRIEIKGDKEKLQKMWHMHKGFKPRSFFGRGRSRFWGRGHAYGPPPWAWEWEEMKEEQAAPPEDTEA